MCFSATASFSASAILAITGIIAVRHAHSHSLKLFASMPLLFAAQQAAEGIVWVTDPTTLLHKLAVYFFISCAFIIWPLWIPGTLTLLEKVRARRIMLYGCCLSGLIAACYAIMRMMEGMHAEVTNHIYYIIGSQTKIFIVPIMLYLIATVGASFISTHRYMSLLGTLMALSYAATLYWYWHHFVSVWCFFAALISVFVLLVVMSNELQQQSHSR